MAIIQLLLDEIYYLHRQIAWLMSFIAQYIPLKQFAFDDSKSPKYQKFKTDILPKFQISLRRTSDIMWDIHGVKISHQQIANYCKTAAMIVKPFVDHYDYKPSSELTADETYIKVRGITVYVWLIMDSLKRSILGYRCSESRSVGPCILTIRQALRHFRDKLPEDFRFVADGYSAYPLAAMQFEREYGDDFSFEITQVIGLTNDDPVSTEFRSLKQKIERLNRTFKASYRKTCGYDSYENADLDLALWVAYYNFLRPHRHCGRKVLNPVPVLECVPRMPDKWQQLIMLGQRKIIQLQNETTA